MAHTTAIIINPKAGTKSSRVGIETLSAYAKSFSIPVYYTKHQGHAKELSNELKQQFNTIVAAGGDGTINEIASELLDTENSLGIIPLGSGNGLAHHLGIPTNTNAAIAHLERQPKKIDTLSINERLVVNIGGFGFDGSIADLFNQSKNRGALAYAKLIIKELMGFKEFNFSISSQSETVEGKAFMILFTNGSEFGNRFIIDPAASCSDGIFNIIIVKKPPFNKLPQLIMAGYRGALKESKYYRKLQLEDVELTPEKDIALQCDGEISANNTYPLKIKLNPKSLNVIY
jgi:diacylglycerol kinase (ATP)